MNELMNERTDWVTWSLLELLIAAKNSLLWYICHYDKHFSQWWQFITLVTIWHSFRNYSLLKQIYIVDSHHWSKCILLINISITKIIPSDVNSLLYWKFITEIKILHLDKNSHCYKNWWEVILWMKIPYYDEQISLW